MQIEIVDLMIGTNIDGVFMDMQVASVAKDNTRDVEEREEVSAVEVEWVDAIVDIEALENDGGLIVIFFGDIWVGLDVFHPNPFEWNFHNGIGRNLL